MATTQATSALLDQTLAALQGDITSAGHISTVANWLSALQGQPGLEDIAAELQTLQDALTSATPDSDEIADSLSSLGELTSSAAVSATPDTQTKLQQLGDALSSAASQV